MEGHSFSENLGRKHKKKKSTTSVPMKKGQRTKGNQRKRVCAPSESERYGKRKKQARGEVSTSKKGKMRAKARNVQEGTPPRRSQPDEGLNSLAPKETQRTPKEATSSKKKQRKVRESRNPRPLGSPGAKIPGLARKESTEKKKAPAQKEGGKAVLRKRSHLLKKKRDDAPRKP